MIVRYATYEDLNTIVALEKLSFPFTTWNKTQWEYEFKENPCAHILVLEESKVFAYIDFWLLYEQAEICKIAVVEPLRRKGAGSILLKEAMKIMLENGVERINLEVRTNNFAAIELYKKFGFEIVQTKEKYYEDGQDAYQMIWKGETCPR